MCGKVRTFPRQSKSADSSISPMSLDAPLHQASARISAVQKKLHQQAAVLQTSLNSGGSRPAASVRHSHTALRNTGLPDALRIPTPCLQVDALLHGITKGVERTDVCRKAAFHSSLSGGDFPAEELARSARRSFDGCLDPASSPYSLAQTLYQT